MVCLRQGTEESPFGTMPPYMTTDVVTVRPQTPLPELMRRMIDSRLDRLVVVDEHQRPRGIVSATDILAAIANAGELALGDSGDGASKEHRSRFGG
jgi:CBS domain-containing protein